jgi:pimeloyl-ACP methyl ester carboxylesterase
MSTPGSTPTVVLVHGAFADASGWAGVINELQSDGVPVIAPPNPLRSMNGDADYIARRVRQIDGPVLLVGHSYGGAVITVAGAGADNVVGLVYIAAFAPDVGETIGEINARFPAPRLADEGVLQANTIDDGGAVELEIAADIYPGLFAPSLSPDEAAAAAVSQRPLTAFAFLEDRASAAAWKTLPSWAVVAGADEAINPDAERFMAERAGADTIEIHGPHTVMMADPVGVTNHIRTALLRVPAAQEA